MQLVNQGAALLVKDKDAKDKAVAEALKLAADENLRESMRAQLKTLAIKDADEKIADAIMKNFGKTIMTEHKNI
ncbi:MAG: hypothetical protein QM804_03880 [Propionicimonas sp.]